MGSTNWLREGLIQPVSENGLGMPMEHRVDRFRALTEVPFINATCVDPEVLELILSGLFSAELNLSITVLLFTAAIS